LPKTNAPLAIKLFGPGFAALKSDYGVDQFQFYTPPALSYLRIASTGTASTEMLGSAAELARQSNTLREEVNRFLAHIRAA